jgi:anti-sigma factor RsiW
MSRHGHVQHLLLSYIDGDLAPGKARRVEAHLAVCPACTQELEQWRGMLRLISYHAAVACPIDCAEAVLQRIESRQPPPWLASAPVSSRRRWFTPHLALTVSMAALLGGIWLGASRGTSNLARDMMAHVSVMLPGDHTAGWIPASSGARFHEATSGPHGGSALLPVAYTLQPDQALRVHAPDRLQQAFGRSDSLILAADFAEDDR